MIASDWRLQEASGSPQTSQSPVEPGRFSNVQWGQTTVPPPPPEFAAAPDAPPPTPGASFISTSSNASGGMSGNP